MIRFTYDPAGIDPKALHHEFLRAGVRPSMYSFYPRRDCWTLTIEDLAEAVVIQDVMEGLGIAFEEQFVPSRFAEAGPPNL